MPSTTAALSLRNDDSEPRGEEAGDRAIREIKDPDLAPKLAFEIARAMKLELPVPSDVKAL